MKPSRAANTKAMEEDEAAWKYMNYVIADYPGAYYSHMGQRKAIDKLKRKVEKLETECAALRQEIRQQNSVLNEHYRHQTKPQ